MPRLPTLIGIVVMCALTACIPSRTTQLQPADMLPAGSTLALLSNITTADAADYNRWIKPMEAASWEGRVHMAWIQLPSRHMAWVRFTPTGDAAAPFPYTIDTSDSAALPLIGTGETVLSADATFNRAAALHPDAVSWAFINGRDWRGIWVGTGSTSIAFPASFSMLPAPDLRQDPADAAIETPALMLFAGGSITVKEIGDRVRSDDVMAAVSLLTTALHELAGSDASLRGDLLPLFEGPFIAYAYPADRSATMPFVVRGTSQSAAEILGRLHEWFIQARPSMSAEERTFDKRFTTENIRIDPAAVEDDMREEHGWMVRKTKRRDDGSTIISAVKGDAFALSTDEEKLLQVIAADVSRLDARTPEGMTTIAGGTIIRGQLSEALRALTGHLADFVGVDGATVWWTLSQGSGIAELTVGTQ